jgi:hypothetical protein
MKKLSEVSESYNKEVVEKIKDMGFSLNEATGIGTAEFKVVLNESGKVELHVNGKVVESNDGGSEAYMKMFEAVKSLSAKK